MMIIERLPFSPIAIVGVKFIGWWSQSDPRYHDDYKNGAYWHTAEDDECKNLPSPLDFIDNEWDPKEKQIVVRYLAKSKYQGGIWFAPSSCRICGDDAEHNRWDTMGIDDYIDVSGRFYHPEGFIHYVNDHNVKPSQEFVDVAMKGMKIT
jgi:hypothetical protein